MPRARLAREAIRAATGWTAAPLQGAATGSRSCCNWDEDALTLAVEAGRGALLESASHRPAAVMLASTTLPFTDRSNATVVSEALDLGESLETVDCCGTLRAGTGAIATAARRREGASLVIASDARLARPGSPQETTYGHGAAALLVVPANPDGAVGDDMLGAILATSHVSSDFVDHYRMAGAEFDYSLEERWIRDEGFMKLVPRAVGNALQRAALEPDDIKYFIFPKEPGVAKRVAAACGLNSATLAGELWNITGDTGTAHPLLLLAGLLESAGPDEAIVMVGFGQGADAIVIQTLPALRNRSSRPLAQSIARGAQESNYVRYLSHSGLLDVDFGRRAERDNRTAHSVSYRKRRAVTGFVGGKCGTCGTVQFPSSRVCVNPSCRAADTQSEYRLADSTGRIKSFTEDWQAYSPSPPLIYGNIEFAEGGNLFMEVTDAAPGSLEAGSAVRFVFRVKDRDALRGYRRYFWKATPLAGCPTGNSEG